MLAKYEAERLQRKIADGSLPADEPLFVLRGRDAFAASLVREWAKRVRGYGTPEASCAEAEELARKMDDWPVHRIPRGCGQPKVETAGDEPSEESGDDCLPLRQAIANYYAAILEQANANRRANLAEQQLEASALYEHGEFENAPGVDADPVRIVCGSTLVTLIPSDLRPRFVINEVTVANPSAPAARV